MSFGLAAAEKKRFWRDESKNTFCCILGQMNMVWIFGGDYYSRYGDLFEEPPMFCMRGSQVNSMVI